MNADERKAAIETIMRAAFRHGYRMASMGFPEPTLEIEWLTDGQPEIRFRTPTTARLTWFQRLAIAIWERAGR